MSIVRAEGISAQVHRDIRDMLIRGEIKPGERLVEVSLAAKLNVSRTPIREAVRKLETEGLVARLPRGGVAAIDARVAIQDLYGLRGRVEGFAAFLAADRGSEDETNDLLELAEAAARLTPDQVQQQTIMCDAFHRQVLEMAQFTQLKALGSILNTHVLDDTGRDYYHYGADARQQICDEHVNVAKLIVQRDCDGAEASMLAHYTSMITMEREAWEPAPDSSQ